MKNSFLGALLIVVKHADSIIDPWALTGSMNHWLQGVNVKPNDIDLISTKTGAMNLTKELNSYIVKPVTYHEEKTIRSWYGALRIGEIDIGLMGEIENFSPLKNCWLTHENWQENIIFIKTNDFRIPCLSLRYEHYVYEKLGFLERAALIKKLSEI
ncbi:MAG: hypothetical protein SH848_17660 [Saprospiraceae bacterium]|nr:hypothetical protein [Saprospiraceae bacterium]MDZ4705758.1 hypothetical protein [Saprospiraceae bacterium]